MMLICRAYVTPIFKKGCSADTNNYRPISITSVVCKLFESIVKQQLLVFLHTHSLVSPAQHGFIVGHSTTTNLLESLNDWTDSIEGNKKVKILYTDLTKAFDRVSVPKLITKLVGYGIQGKLLDCINSF